MKTLIKIKYDKLKYNEFITYNNKNIKFDFGYPILDFISTDIKELLTNTNDIAKELEILSQNNNYFVFNIFYADEILRQLQNVNLDTTEKNKRINKILSLMENKQKLFSTIINFCFLLNADKYFYERQLDKLIFICNKLDYTLKQPTYSYSITTDDMPLTATLKLDDITETTLDELDKEYMNYKTNNRSTVNYYENLVYLCESVDELFSIFMLTIFDRHYTISRCKNCGKLFVPYKKNDALYCDRISPQKENKTCKEFASKQPKGVQELYRKIYMKKFARVNRNKDNYTLKNDYEKWKSQADKLKADLNNGIITADEFEKWLIENDK